ncbi:hypothetical protein F5Y11DRAFT_350599 [Daldinia sp. FL1419]|nr:hypothetical protein F5Y11DRAFT_350599 [Daldinia sp. FL1419]
MRTSLIFSSLLLSKDHAALYATAAPIQSGQTGGLGRLMAIPLAANQDAPDSVSTQSCADGVHTPADKRRAGQEIAEEAERFREKASQNVPDYVST